MILTKCMHIAVLDRRHRTAFTWALWRQVVNLPSLHQGTSWRKGYSQLKVGNLRSLQEECRCDREMMGWNLKQSDYGRWKKSLLSSESTEKVRQFRSLDRHGIRNFEFFCSVISVSRKLTDGRSSRKHWWLESGFGAVRHTHCMYP